MSDSEYVAVKPDFFSKPLYPFENVTLMGSRCLSCGEVFFGKAIACQNCQGEGLEEVPLSSQGILYTYTVARHAPPAGYKGPEPFEPFGIGLVELAEGIRILAPLTGIDVDALRIGLPLRLSIEPFYRDESNRTVLTYSFRPFDTKRGQLSR